MKTMKPLLQHLGIKIIKNEGMNQTLCQCPDCGKSKLYVDLSTGLWKCQRGCDQGNAYKLVAKRFPDMDSKAIFELLDQYGVDTTDHPRAVKPDGRPKLTKDDVIPLIGDELQAFCDVKGVDVDSYLKLAGGKAFRHATRPWALLPGKRPGKLNTTAVMRVHLKGELIKTKAGEEKYPLIAGSTHGLIGAEWIVREKPQCVLLCEGWRDACAATSDNWHAVASTGGASCWKDEWLPLFKKKDVFICMDCDKSGQKAAQRAAYAIYDVAKSVSIIALPYKITADHGKDLYDYLTTEKTTQ